MKTALWVRRLHWLILAATVLLVGLGWIGIARIEELTEGSGRFLQQQMAYSVLALAVMLLIVSLVPITIYLSRVFGRED